MTPTGVVGEYERFLAQKAGPRRLGSLPHLIVSSVAIVWRASPRGVLLTSGLQLLAGAITALQVLVARYALQRVLVADPTHIAFGSALPAFAALAGL